MRRPAPYLRKHPNGVEPTPFEADATLTDVWDVYFDEHITDRNIGTYAAKLAWNQLRPFFGTLPTSALTQNAVDAYARARTKGHLGRRVKPSTAARELVYIIAAVRFCAERRGLIPLAYVRKLELPAQSEPRDRWLREHEQEALHAAAVALRRGTRLSRGERFIWLALETAGRKQALLDLTWDRVDFETKVIHLDVPGRRKTKKRRASVPISDNLLPVLERAFAERINDRVLDNAGDVWPVVQSIVVRAGLAPRRPRATSKKPKGTGISPNVFRHTAATMMARGGVPLWKIAKILGNTLAMVERVYAKHSPDDLRDAINMISGKPKE